MTYHTVAVFEKGTLTPINPLKGIPEHSIVRISVETVTPSSRDAQLAMLRAVPISKELADAIESGRKQEWKTEEF